MSDYEIFHDALGDGNWPLNHLPQLPLDGNENLFLEEYLEVARKCTQPTESNKNV